MGGEKMIAPYNFEYHSSLFSLLPPRILYVFHLGRQGVDRGFIGGS